jgi:hypothetical protein
VQHVSQLVTQRLKLGEGQVVPTEGAEEGDHGELVGAGAGAGGGVLIYVAVRGE